MPMPWPMWKAPNTAATRQQPPLLAPAADRRSREAERTGDIGADLQAQERAGRAQAQAQRGQERHRGHEDAGGMRLRALVA